MIELSTKKITDLQKYSQITEKTYSCELITPAFIAGADGKTPELRTTSIKALMRYWWRASFDGSIDQMKAIEKELFGSTEKKGAFTVLLKCNNPDIKDFPSLPKGEKILTTSKGKSIEFDLIKYLLVGIFDFKNPSESRKYFDAGSKFDIKIYYNKLEIACNNKEVDVISEIEKSLFCLAEFGGIGAKTRNGFGSIAISNIETPKLHLRKLEKEFTCISDELQKIKTKKCSSVWNDTLSDLAKVYYEARISLERQHSYTMRWEIAKPIIPMDPYDRKTMSQIDLKYKEKREPKSLFLRVKKEKTMYRGYIFYLPKKNTQEYKNAYQKLITTIQENPIME